MLLAWLLLWVRLLIWFTYIVALLICVFCSCCFVACFALGLWFASLFVVYVVLVGILLFLDGLYELIALV